MINWNVTDARPPKRLNDVGHEPVPAIVQTASTRPLVTKEADEEKSTRAIALLVAIGLTAIVVIWQNFESLLWWFFTFLALSFWCCALSSFIKDILRVATEWLVEAIAYLCHLLAGWRDGASQFVARWIWSRFHIRQTGGQSNGGDT